MEQKIVAVYLAVGIACGVLSDFLAGSSMTFALILPVLGFFGTMLPLVRIVKERRIKMLVSNGLITFFLVWIMTWVLLFNL